VEFLRAGGAWSKFGGTMGKAMEELPRKACLPLFGFECSGYLAGNKKSGSSAPML